MTNRMKTTAFILGLALVYALVFAMAFVFANAPTANAMEIFAKTLDGDTITLEVEPSDTIENVKMVRLVGGTVKRV